jgi:hypothetical protein
MRNLCRTVTYDFLDDVMELEQHAAITPQRTYSQEYHRGNDSTVNQMPDATKTTTSMRKSEVARQSQSFVSTTCSAHLQAHSGSL